MIFLPPISRAGSERPQLRPSRDVAPSELVPVPPRPPLVPLPHGVPTDGIPLRDEVRIPRCRNGSSDSRAAKGGTLHIVLSCERLFSAHTLASAISRHAFTIAWQLYCEPYDSIDWDKTRHLVADMDNYSPIPGKMFPRFLLVRTSFPTS